VGDSYWSITASQAKMLPQDAFDRFKQIYAQLANGISRVVSDTTPLISVLGDTPPLPSSGIFRGFSAFQLFSFSAFQLFSVSAFQRFSVSV